MIRTDGRTLKMKKELYRWRRQKMLEDKIDVAGFRTWFIENYPGSVETMRRDPDFQYGFR